MSVVVSKLSGRVDVQRVDSAALVALSHGPIGGNLCFESDGRIRCSKKVPNVPMTVEIPSDMGLLSVAELATTVSVPLLGAIGTGSLNELEYSANVHLGDRLRIEIPECATTIHRRYYDRVEYLFCNPTNGISTELSADFDYLQESEVILRLDFVEGDPGIFRHEASTAKLRVLRQSRKLASSGNDDFGITVKASASVEVSYDDLAPTYKDCAPCSRELQISHWAIDFGDGALLRIAYRRRLESGRHSLNIECENSAISGDEFLSLVNLVYLFIRRQIAPPNTNNVISMSRLQQDMCNLPGLNAVQRKAAVRATILATPVSAAPLICSALCQFVRFLGLRAYDDYTRRCDVVSTTDSDLERLHCGDGLSCGDSFQNMLIFSTQPVPDTDGEWDAVVEMIDDDLARAPL